MKTGKRILVCPLEWGLGHATRCVPVIRELTKQGAEVIIGSHGRPLAFLRREFPEMLFIEMPGYRFRYPEKRSMALHMLFSAPRILRGIRGEHRLLNRIVKDFRIDAVISDNRYGCWNDNIPCIFITHQLRILAPPLYRWWSEPVLLSMNRNFISKYDELWIPDREGEFNLSGVLSHPGRLPANAHYIGPLSRFDMDFEPEDHDPSFQRDVLVILSGPEPQRTVLEQMIFGQIRDFGGSALIVRGITENDGFFRLSGSIEVYDHMDTNILARYILNARTIVCRPGYSTLMDLFTLGKRALLIPTPGQTEQEYLASYLEGKMGFATALQKNIQLLDSIKSMIDQPVFKPGKEDNALETRIRLLLER